jgi:hypothetical protein
MSDTCKEKALCATAQNYLQVAIGPEVKKINLKSSMKNYDTKPEKVCHLAPASGFTFM